MRLSYEGDREIARSYLQDAERELFALKERMRHLGLSQGSFHAACGAGEAYIYGYVLPTGLEAIHIVADPIDGGAKPTEYFDPQVPDFLSGYLVSGRLVEVSGEERVRDFRAGVSCQRLHKQEVGAGRNQVRRLAIKPGDIAGMDSGADIAQASVIRPTMYSGTMRKVVQFLLGLGKQFADESIYDAAEPPLPDQIVEESEDTPTEFVDETAYESLVKSQGVRLTYDHRFQRTHGLIRATDNRWWLVEISQGRGILMMPLPLCRYTDLPEFREKCVTLDDQEAIKVLDLFGGFPSGESFPTDARAIESAVRSGRILRPKTASDVGGFYALDGYSSIMGWAFSDSGAEAHNTGFTIDDQGYARGSHYAAQMRVGAFVDVEPDDAAEELKGIIAEARGAVSAQVYDELLWKCDRLNHSQVTDLLSLAGTKEAVDVANALDELTLSPSAAATATFSRVSEGYLWTRALYGPQVKFPEPILGGCVSAPIYQADGSLPPVRCDTTLHVFFIGEELKWVKYFVRPGESANRVTADSYTGREDVPVGDFYYERHSGEFGVSPTVYTNNFDDRVERGESIYSVRYKRRFAGYYEMLTRSLGAGDRTSDFTDRAFDPPIPGNNISTAPFIWRNAKFAYEEWRQQRNNYGMRTAVIVPMEDRCSYYYTIEEGNAGGSDFYWFHYEIVSDPTVGLYNWPGEDFKVSSTSRSYSVGSQLWPNHQERIDYADRGEWVPIGADVRALVTKEFINLNNYSRSTTVLVSPRWTLTCKFICASEHTPVQVFTITKTGSDFYPSRWFMQSPDPDSGVVDVVNSTHNALGDATALIYSKDINTTDRELKGLPNDTVLRSVIPTFIGPFDA